MMTALLTFTLAAVAAAQSPLSMPMVGAIRDSGRGVRPVMGVAGSFILGDVVMRGAVSAAFSSRLGIVKTNTALLAVDTQNRILATQDVSGGPALIGFPAASANAEALVYLPHGPLLELWNGSSFTALPFDAAQVAGVIVSVTMAGSDGAVFLVQRENGLWRVQSNLSTGSVQSEEAVPGVASGPAMALPDGSLLYADSGGLVLRRPDASELRYPFSGTVASFEHMKDDWVHIREEAGPRRQRGHDFAICLTTGHEQVYELPRSLQQLQ